MKIGLGFGRYYEAVEASPESFDSFGGLRYKENANNYAVMRGVKLYALESVKKFLRDNPDKVGDRASDILARAEEHSKDGVFWGSSIAEIMGSPDLANEFRQAALTDPDHIEIGVSAISALPPLFG